MNRSSSRSSPLIDLTRRPESRPSRAARTSSGILPEGSDRLGCGRESCAGWPTRSVGPLLPVIVTSLEPSQRDAGNWPSWRRSSAFPVLETRGRRRMPRGGPGAWRSLTTSETPGSSPAPSTLRSEYRLMHLAPGPFARFPGSVSQRSVCQDVMIVLGRFSSAGGQLPFTIRSSK